MLWGAYELSDPVSLLRGDPVRQFFFGCRSASYLAIGREPGGSPTRSRARCDADRPDEASVHGDAGREEILRRLTAAHRAVRKGEGRHHAATCTAGWRGAGCGYLFGGPPGHGVLHAAVQYELPAGQDQAVVSPPERSRGQRCERRSGYRDSVLPRPASIAEG